MGEISATTEKENAGRERCWFCNRGLPEKGDGKSAVFCSIRCSIDAQLITIRAVNELLNGMMVFRTDENVGDGKKQSLISRNKRIWGARVGGMQLSRIADKEGLSTERVRQIVIEALEMGKRQIESGNYNR